MRVKFTQDTFLIGLFLLMICLPGLVMFASPIATISELEKRPLAPLPQLEQDMSVSVFRDNLQSFVKDHFGFREFFVEVNSWISYFVFHTSSQRSVIMGKEGWLYVNTLHGGIWTTDNYYRGVVPLLNNDQLEAFRLRMEANRDELAAQGIAYYFLLTPDKHTVYDQYLADAYQPIRRTTWLDQIADYMAENSDVPFLDSRPVIREAAQANPDTLYFYPLGSHWTSYGAWIGYEMLMDRIREDFPGLRSYNWDNLVDPVTQGDVELVQTLRLTNWITEPLRAYKWPTNRCAESVETEQHNQNWRVPEPKQGLELMYYTCQEPLNPQTLLLFHDSNSLALIPTFAETFGTTASVWADYTPELMARISVDVQPDIVIEQSVERLMIPYILELE